MIAIDTNLLVYAHRSRAPEHPAARGALERAAAEPRGWGMAQASAVEFLAVVTHPADSRPSTVAEARRFLQALANAGCETWRAGPTVVVDLVARADELGIRGPRFFDLQIALTALEHGASELWTHDAHFVRVPGLRVRDPL
jgi:toxin-antitoxin system PIN domain toxin